MSSNSELANKFSTITNNVFALVSCSGCYIIENYLRIFLGTANKYILVVILAKTEASSIKMLQMGDISQHFQSHQQLFIDLTI